MSNLVEVPNVPGLESSRMARIGHALITMGLSVKALHAVVMVAAMFGLTVISVSAQTPSGSFFNGNSGQLGNSLRSVTFFLAAAMIIAGIIFALVLTGLQWLFIFQSLLVTAGAILVFAGAAYLIAQTSCRYSETNVLHNLHVIATGRSRMFKEIN